MALSIDTMIRLLVRSAFVLAAPSLALAFAPQSGISTVPFWMYEGNQIDGFIGWSVADAGDVNGDGFDDVLVGAKQFTDPETEEGAALLFLGSASGLAATPSWQIQGGQNFLHIGEAVDGGADINGDGFDDVLVSTSGNGIQPGHVGIYLGSAGGLSTTPLQTIQFGGGLGTFGAVAAFAGDVDGDGFEDLVVGAPTWGNGQSFEGAAFLFLGNGAGFDPQPAWTIEGNKNFATLGNAFGVGGDVNGDGLDDVIVGAEGWSNGQQFEGRILVYYGSSSGTPLVLAWTLEANQSGALFGRSASIVGDTNGDGVDDVVVGSAGASHGQASEGRAFLYLGSASGLGMTPAWSAEGDLIGGSLGWSVAGVGDVNSDGLADFAVGSAAWDSPAFDAGAAWLYYGAPGGAQSKAVWFVEGAASVDQFGYSLAGGGDVDGDGHVEFFVGAPYASHPEFHEGRISGFSGCTDLDADGVCDDVDNCDELANPGQEDCDGDGLGDVCELASGSLDLDGDLIPDECASLGVAYCFGDGGDFPCPCGNEASAPNEGCANSTGRGASIYASGGTSVGADDTVLTAIHLPANKFGVVFFGASRMRVPFGDGALCVGGPFTRLATQAANSNGVLTQADPVSVSGGAIGAGATLDFQCWYRDPQGPCSQGHNLSNGLELTFGP